MLSIIFILGLLGIVTAYSMGGLIHILLVIHNNGAGKRYSRAEDHIGQKLLGPIHNFLALASAKD